MRQAYDYWQDQPGSFVRSSFRERLSLSLERRWSLHSREREQFVIGAVNAAGLASRSATLRFHQPLSHRGTEPRERDSLRRSEERRDVVFHTSKIIIFFLILPCDRRDRNRLSTLTLDRRCDAETSRNKFVDRVREYNTRGRIRLFAKDYKYTRKGSLLPSLASVESMFGKRATIHPIHVRLRTREVRAANTYACAPRKSHSVFRHRLVAMLCRNGEKVTSNAVNRSEANDSDEYSGGPPHICSPLSCTVPKKRTVTAASPLYSRTPRDPRIVRNRRARRSATRRSSTETIVTENLDVTEPRGTREWPAAYNEREQSLVRALDRISYQAQQTRVSRRKRRAQAWSVFQTNIVVYAANAVKLYSSTDEHRSLSLRTVRNRSARRTATHGRCARSILCERISMRRPYRDLNFFRRSKRSAP